jgi:hypothetical protein
MLLLTFAFLLAFAALACISIAVAVQQARKDFSWMSMLFFGGLLPIICLAAIARFTATLYLTPFPNPATVTFQPTTSSVHVTWRTPVTEYQPTAGYSEHATMFVVHVGTKTCETTPGAHPYSEEHSCTVYKLAPSTKYSVRIDAYRRGVRVSTLPDSVGSVSTLATTTEPVYCQTPTGSLTANQRHHCANYFVPGSA